MKVEIKPTCRAMFLTAGMVLASFCPVQAQFVCTHAVNAAVDAIKSRDSLDQISYLNGVISIMQANHCMMGCTEEESQNAVSPDERLVLKQAVSFAYSPEGRRLSEDQLREAVHQWCVKTYGGY
jgi:hypothetical protein